MADSGRIGAALAVLMGVISFIVITGQARSTTVETLLMPGKVTRAHEKQEGNCANCHDRSNVRPQSTLCLDCHKEIAADLRGRTGFHGRMPNSGVGECRACHTEHKGRSADIVQLDRVMFDHRLTEFPLEGAHAGLSCAGCHVDKQPWRKAPTSCAGCHKKDDAHAGQLAQGCGECHGTLTWSGGRFDHDKTRFKLTGLHAGVACNACHVGGRYRPTASTCVGCHATDDVHAGSRGDDCGKCHTTKEWKSGKFDHLKETGYALLGSHADVDCAGCHRSGNYKDKIPKSCAGCHAAQDAHAMRFGTSCDECHDNERWRPAPYDHAKKARFALEGVHARIDCHACHTAPVAVQKLPTDCNGCHRGEDPHGNVSAGLAAQRCDACHGERSWSTEIAFNHDLSSFPLLGLHRVASCAQCHATLAFARAPSQCVDCHAADDFHKGGLGKKCAACHSSNGWALWTFDHAKQAHFALIGAHSKLQCADCHREPPGTVKMSQQCDSCHRKDDRHLGQYGQQCDRCHTSYSWKGARIQ